MTNKSLFSFITAITAFALVLFVGFAFHWCVNRVYVPEGKSLLLRYKGPLFLGKSNMATPGHWADEGQVGILEKLRGPGRHFYCPIWWERQLVDDYIIKTGEVGIVTCKLGDNLPKGEFLVDGELGATKFKGVLRKTLGPGLYRINPYGYDVQIVKQEISSTKKYSGWVSIPTGFVGVVTNLTSNPLLKQAAGIQNTVLPSGLYPINPREQQIDVVKIGYRETSINFDSEVKDTAKLVDSTGDEVKKGGISFPSSDGFNIVMDFTTVWGLMPDQAPNAIRVFGNVELVENKVVLPQIECRNNGSEYSATQLLVGKEREVFQNDTLNEFQRVLGEKKITLLYGLVRHIYIPKAVRLPIQTSFIADELKLTREQEQLTAQEEGALREAEKKVELEQRRVETDTERLVAEAKAIGEKTVGETAAETKQLTASVELKQAELESQAKVILGEAETNGDKLIEQAKADKFKLAVAAFKTPTAYNNWVFATNLPVNLELKLFYAGAGTMWTDLKSAMLTVPTTPTPAVAEKK